MPRKTYTRQLRKDPRIHKNNEHWSDAQKLEAVTLWMMTGSWVQVSAATKVPVDTLKHWKMADWWKDAQNALRHQANVKVSGKLQRIIDKSSDIVLDRLENGDIHFDPKTGKVTRKEVNAKTASEILTKSIDKDQLIQKLEQAPEVKEEAIMDRLKSIQEQLRKATKYKHSNVIDVEPVEIDNGETGRLQDASGERDSASSEVERGDGSEVRQGDGELIRDGGS